MPNVYLLPNYTVCHAQDSDLADITAIYNSSIAGRQATADLIPLSTKQARAEFDRHSTSRPLYVVKQASGRIIAWGRFSDYHPRPAYHITAQISIYVHPSMHKQGIGRSLVQYMCTRAPTLGIHNIIALIFSHNRPSLSLFRKFGFQQWGLLPQVCDMQTGLADIVILGKKIDPRP